MIFGEVIKPDSHYFHFRSSTKSQVYTLKFGSQKIPVYCHMGNFGCGDGGWTLAMKINGAKVKGFSWPTEVKYVV